MCLSPSFPVPLLQQKICHCPNLYDTPACAMHLIHSNIFRSLSLSYTCRVSTLRLCWLLDNSNFLESLYDLRKKNRKRKTLSTAHLPLLLVKLLYFSSVLPCFPLTPYPIVFCVPAATHQWNGTCHGHSEAT